ncbi:hypothetical protein [Sphingomonas nostoxanthinifaciens]|uniref:hypothetical protein n=1 Tax=Sphingomonas nostoxanthinifaciens TaxID=2872652 RepID=UPI001CC1E8E4|nr:hypothetical protein [Sphingomonas nostoxanthinifaciens]UAK23634.1 hypothetical protein K8P63_14760 [Sphingomonas nostoxanthinifaciens]
MAADDRPSPDELRALIVEILESTTNDDGWHAIVGPVQTVPELGQKTNWRIDACGSPADRSAFLRAVATVRGLHPYAKG